MKMLPQSGDADSTGRHKECTLVIGGRGLGRSFGKWTINNIFKKLTIWIWWRVLNPTSATSDTVVTQ